MGGHRIGTAAVAALTALAAAGAAVPARAAAPAVLRVGVWKGVAGTFATIQSAVDAAQPGDWILVGPGDWHEKGGNSPQRSAGVLIQKPSLHLRGMDRNGVIIDGTNPTATVACDPSPAVQDPGPVDPSTSKPAGRNGIEVYGKGFVADGVSIENLTVCNYLASGGGGNGNEIWWNGGDGSGQIGMGSLYGAYLTASSSYNYATDAANTDMHQAKYGIFTSNEKGPGVITQTYASNMGDSDYYIGACPDCNLVLDTPHGVNGALGYSGTNGGGHLIIQNGEWDHNLAGIGPNTLNNDDSPSPANGACPSGTGPTGTTSCFIIRGNYVHDNNNPNTPRAGIAGAAPVGTGILVSGVQNATVIGNRIEGNGGWGILVTDFPDTSTPPAEASAQGQACRGGTDLTTPAQPLCYYQASGNEITANAFKNNGGYGVGTGDIGQVAIASTSGNCYHGDTDPAGVTTDPPGLETLAAACGQPGNAPGVGAINVVCQSSAALNLPVAVTCPSAPSVANFPQTTQVAMFAIPHNLATMPDPCAGVPVNPWCAQVVTSTPVGSIPNTAAPSAATGPGVALAITGLAAGGLVGIAVIRVRRRGGVSPD